ncbi:hypothetical protein ACOALZ_20690 [Nocardiopsis algeriensis]|uniref:hypothetical protein n=1 Tax=Nocardiopsis algeriensis TaxID=1478215 RepID=UPI003B4374F0
MSFPHDPETVPPAQPQNRGCAITGLVAGAVVLLLLAAGAVWYVLDRDAPDNGAYDAAPECSVGETDVLDELMPGYELEFEEPLGSPQDPYGSGRQCRWAIPGGPGEEVPSAATLVVVAAPDPGGETIAEATFDATVSGQDTTPVADLGDEAVAWTARDRFVFACVGIRVSNLYAEACYGTAADYSAYGYGDEDRTTERAEEYARSVVTALPAPDRAY